METLYLIILITSIVLYLLFVLFLYKYYPNNIEGYAKEVPLTIIKDMNTIFTVTPTNSPHELWNNQIKTPFTPFKTPQNLYVWNVNLTVQQGNKRIPHEFSRFKMQNLFNKVVIKPKAIRYHKYAILPKGLTSDHEGENLLTVALPPNQGLDLFTVTLNGLCTIMFDIKENMMEVTLLGADPQTYIAEMNFAHLEHAILHFGKYTEKEIYFGMNGVPFFTFEGSIKGKSSIIKGLPEKAFEVFISSI